MRRPVDNDDDDSDDVMMMMMVDRGLNRKKNPISDVSSNVFSAFSSHYIRKGN